MCYLQSGLSICPPFAFKKLPSCESRLARMSVYLTKKSPSWCSSRCWIWPPSRAKSPEWGLSFLYDLCATLWKPQPQIEFTHLTVLLDFRGNTFTEKKIHRFCKTVYMLVVNAMSVCKLVSALRLEFTRMLQVITNVLLLSEAMVVGREHRRRAYRSVSKAFWAEGGKRAMCGFAFIVLFTSVIVLFCIVV